MDPKDRLTAENETLRREVARLGALVLAFQRASDVNFDAHEVQPIQLEGRIAHLKRETAAAERRAKLHADRADAFVVLAKCSLGGEAEAFDKVAERLRVIDAALGIDGEPNLIAALRPTTPSTET